MVSTPSLRPAGRLAVAAARRTAVVAAYGGGGVGIAGASAAGLLFAQARLARHVVGTPTEDPPVADGLYGQRGADGEPALVLAMLGDSSAAGIGVHRPHETPGALLAAGLAAVSGRQVRLVNVARSGAQSSDLDAQVDAVLPDRPHGVVVMIGANDVTHRVRPAVSVRLLGEAVRRLVAEDCPVVVGTCPDLGTIEPLAQPLRSVARQWSRQLAAAQTIGVVEAGGRTVSLGDLLGHEFIARRRELFSADRFHPSAAGYASLAAALLPSLCVALGVWPEDEPDAGAHTRADEVVRPVAVAAVEASQVAGTEVAAAEVAGRERGPRGRWAALRRRPARAIPTQGEAVEAVEAEQAAAPPPEHMHPSTSV